MEEQGHTTFFPLDAICSGDGIVFDGDFCIEMVELEMSFCDGEEWDE